MKFRTACPANFPLQSAHADDGTGEYVGERDDAETIVVLDVHSEVAGHRDTHTDLDVALDRLGVFQGQDHVSSQSLVFEA